MADEDICKTVNCHTEKLNNLITGVCEIKESLYKQCPVIIGEGASGPDTSVVLGCDALGSDESVVVGNDATSQGNSRNVVVGYMANANNTDSVVIGHMAEGNTGSIVIGKDSVSSGNNSIVIGKNANLFEDNSILLDATDNDTSGKFYVKPIRNAPGPVVLCYNTGTCEITYETEIKKQIPVGCGLTYSDRVQLEFKTNSNALTGALGVERNHIIVNNPCNPSPSHFYVSQVHGESGYGIVMGQQNTLTGETKNSTIAGGYNNEIEKSNYAFIGGGKGNTAYGNYSNIVGGKYNDVKGTGTFIGGGQYNTIYLSKDSKYSFIGSGSNNIVDGEASNIIGGEGNTIENKRSNIVGGVNNKIYSIGSNIVGGFQNKINNNSDYSSIVGGQCNTITGAATYAFIGGGEGNTTSNEYATIGGGQNNTSSGSRSFIGGGKGNTASNQYSTIGGGQNNMAMKEWSTIGGGQDNIAMSQYVFIGGGVNNMANGRISFIGGGERNTASGDFSSILGGQDNTATGTYSIAFGQNSNANKDYSAVFGLNAAGTSAPAENTLTIGVGNSGQKRGIYYLDAPSDTGTNLVITSDGQIVKDTKSTLPVGTCYSDYLYWDTGSQQWENGNNDSKDRVHIGCGAGQFNQQDETIAIGDKAGRHSQQGGAVAIGSNAGETNQREAAIAIGIGAGNDNQGEKSIAIGADSGKQNQETGAISIGLNAGKNNQKQNSIAIGQKADLNGCNNNTIILNAQTNTELDSTDPSSFYVKPVRELNAPNMLCYNTGTGEISYQPKLLSEIIEIKFGYGTTPGTIDGSSNTANIDIQFYKYNNGIINMIFLDNLFLISTSITYTFITTNIGSIPVEYRPMMDQSFPIMIFKGALGPVSVLASLIIQTNGTITIVLCPPVQFSPIPPEQYKVCGGQVFGWM